MPGKPAWIGLGGNQGDREALLAEAVRQVAAADGVKVVKQSSIYETEPWGEPDQPPFLNAVIEVLTTQPPGDLLDRLLAIEAGLGRRRNGKRWGPRPIDLDLLVYAGLQICSPALEVPHPRLAQRAFVLVPLAEIAPGLEVPGQGLVEQLLSAVDVRTVRQVVAKGRPGE